MKLSAIPFTPLLSLIAFTAFAQQPALIITRINPQPPTQANNEYVELLATRAINFATEPFTVIVTNIGGSTNVTSGWITGGGVTYAIEVNTGTVAQGDLLYVGGNSFTVSGTGCKTFRVNTNNNSATGIGSGSSSGVFGDGGGQQDGIGIFAGAASAIAAATTPVDALFYGSAGTYGSQVTGKFKVPANDLYNGGYAGNTNNTFLGPNPTSTNYVLTATTGTFYTNTFMFGTARSFSLGNATPNCAYTPGVTFATANTLSIAVNTALTTPFINPPNIGGVISDPTDPAAQSGIVFNIQDNGAGIPAANYTLSGASSNTTVVPNASIVVTQAAGQATVKITPAAVGYSTVTLTLTKGSFTKTYAINYAASAAAATPANTAFHTGYSDASAAIALDDTYMLTVDDEKNVLGVYDRNNSGLPATTYDYSGISGLNLTDLNGSVPRETDLEAEARSLTVANRIYFLGSHSNQSTGSFNSRPNRNRIFAMSVTGTGATTAFSYTGDYESLRADLISWGTSNSLGLSTSAASGKDPKGIDGFNIEGMAFAPDTTTLYIGFRAPLEPVSSRVNALITPVQNFESFFGTGSPSGSPMIGTPILLALGGRGIRDMVRLSANQFIILAGDYDDAGAISPAIYKWNGNAANAPVLLSGFNVSGLNPEGVMPVYSGGVMSANQLQVISDNGSTVFYNDATAAKDLAVDNFKKFRSDLLTSPGTPLPVVFEDFNAVYAGNGRAALDWRCGRSAAITSFEVEQSDDGAAFHKVATVYGNAAGSYAFSDVMDASKEVSFYRIKAMEADGASYYTNIRMVRQPAFGEGQPIIYKTGNGMLHVTAAADGAKQLRILNVAGQVAASYAFAGITADFSLVDLPAGMYVVELRDGQQILRRRIAK